MIRSRDELWNAVDEALDARRDPLADTAVQAWIAEHPEDVDALARLDRGLRMIARAPQRRATKPVLAFVSAAALALGLLTWLRDDEASRRAPHHDPRSAILSYRLDVSTETRDTSVVVTLENGRLTRERELRIQGHDALARVTVSTRREGLR